MATCPECDAELEIDDDDLEEMEVGDPWDCEACGSRLRVASLDPLDFETTTRTKTTRTTTKRRKTATRTTTTSTTMTTTTMTTSGGGDWDE